MCIAALGLACVSLMWQMLSLITPRTVFASRLSIQTPAQSTRASVYLEGDDPTAMVYLPHGQRVLLRFSAQGDTPVLSMKRLDRSSAGELLWHFPSEGPPTVQRRNADGSPASLVPTAE